MAGSFFFGCTAKTEIAVEVCLVSTWTFFFYISFSTQSGWDPGVLLENTYTYIFLSIILPVS